MPRSATIIRVMGFCLSAIFLGQAFGQTTAQEHAEIAYSLWDKTDPTSEELATAIHHMSKAAELEPEAYKWTYNLGVFYYGTSDWENAKEAFAKAMSLAKTEEDRKDAETWLDKSEVKIHQERIERTRSEGLVVGNSERDFTRFSMKESEVFEERPVERDKPILPQIAAEASAQPLIDYFTETIPEFNAIVEDVFVVVGPYNEDELRRHYRRGIHDFHAFFKQAYFSKPMARFLSVMISEKPYELVDAVKKIDPEARLQVYAPFVGFYISADNLVVATIGGGYGTLLHEMMHALIENEAPNTPRWLDEAMASLYERAIWRSGRLTPLPNWRMLLMHGRALSLSDLEHVVRASHINAYEFANLRLFFVFLDRQDRVADFYKLARQPAGDSPIKSALGQHGAAEAEEAWQAFAKQAAEEYDLELKLASGVPSFAELKGVQQALNEILGLDLSVDGIWGGNTEKAVKQFQSRFGLTVSGRCDPKTLDRIDREYRAIATKR